MLLIANPAAGGGMTAGRRRELARVASAVLPHHELVWTREPGDATRLARDCAGFDVVAAVGGDGTAHEVVNGLVQEGRAVHPGVAFGLVNLGTGGDLARTLKVPSRLDAALARLAEGPVRPMDAIDVTLQSLDGEGEVRRTCINVAGIGLNARVVEIANASGKRWGGRVTFAASTVRGLLRFGPTPVRLEWADETGLRNWEGELLSGFLANGQFCGGGMWVGRGGSVADGRLDLTIVPRLPWFTLVRNGYRLFTGTIGSVKDVSTARVSDRLLAFAAASKIVLVELDGELSGQLPGIFRVTPDVMLVAA